MRDERAGCRGPGNECTNSFCARGEAGAAFHDIERGVLSLAEKPGRWGREGLLGGSIRVVARRLGFTTEGQLEFTGNLRPEFAEDVETRVLKDAEGYPLRCWRETALSVGVIGVAQDDRGCRAQPFGKIEHALAIVAVGHYRVLQRMEQARAGAAVGQAVVAGVLREYPRIRKVLKEPGGGLTGEFGAKAPAIPLSALSIAGVRA